MTFAWKSSTPIYNFGDTHAIATMPRLVAANSRPMVNQRLRLAFINAPKTASVTALKITTANVAAGATPTLIRFGIYELDSDDNGALVAATANENGIFAAPYTDYIVNLDVPYSARRGTRFAVGALIVTSFTLPALPSGAGAAGATVSEDPPRTAGRIEGFTDLPSTFAATAILSDDTVHYMQLL